MFCGTINPRRHLLRCACPGLTRASSFDSHEPLLPTNSLHRFPKAVQVFLSAAASVCGCVSPSRAPAKFPLKGEQFDLLAVPGNGFAEGLGLAAAAFDDVLVQHRVVRHGIFSVVTRHAK